MTKKTEPIDYERRYFDLCAKVDALLSKGENAWMYGPDFLDHEIDLSWTGDYTRFWSWDLVTTAVCENPGGLFDSLYDADGLMWPKLQRLLVDIRKTGDSVALKPERRRGRIAKDKLEFISLFLNYGFPPKRENGDSTTEFVPTFRLRRDDEVVQTHPGIVPYGWVGSKDNENPDGWTLFEHTGETGGPSFLRGYGITFNTRDKAAWAGMTFTDLFRDFFTMHDDGSLMREVDGSLARDDD